MKWERLSCFNTPIENKHYVGANFGNNGVKIRDTLSGFWLPMSVNDLLMVLSRQVRDVCAKFHQNGLKLRPWERGQTDRQRAVPSFVLQCQRRAVVVTQLSHNDQTQQPASEHCSRPVLYRHMVTYYTVFIYLTLTLAVLYHANIQSVNFYSGLNDRSHFEDH